MGYALDGWLSSIIGIVGAVLIALLVMRLTLRHDDKRAIEDREIAKRNLSEERAIAEQRARAQRGIEAGDGVCAALHVMYDRAMAGDTAGIEAAHQQAVIAWIKLRSAVASTGGADFCRYVDRIEQAVFEYSVSIAKINNPPTWNPSRGFQHTPAVIDAIVRWTQARAGDEVRRDEETFLAKMQEEAERQLQHVRT